MASISVDFDANAMYVSLSKDKKVKQIISLGKDVFIDTAKDNTIIGVEILLPKMPLEAKKAFLHS